MEGLLSLAEIDVVEDQLGRLFERDAARVDDEVIVLGIAPRLARVEVVVVLALLLDLVELIEAHAAVVGLGALCTESVIGADEEGVDFGLSGEDDVSTAPEEDGALSLRRDGADDFALLGIELPIGRYTVE